MPHILICACFLFYIAIQSKIFSTFSFVCFFDPWDREKCGLFKFPRLWGFYIYHSVIYSKFNFIVISVTLFHFSSFQFAEISLPWWVLPTHLRRMCLLLLWVECSKFPININLVKLVDWILCVFWILTVHLHVRLPVHMRCNSGRTFEVYSYNCNWSLQV